jgi:hypothetical protein
MTVCDNERSLAVIYGQKLNKNKKDPCKIFIFERKIIDGDDRFVQTKVIDIEAASEGEDDLKGICMQFHFANKLKGEDFSDTLIFAKQDRIIKFDYGSNIIKVIQKFDEGKGL